MNRPRFLLLLSLALFAFPPRSAAQQSARGHEGFRVPTEGSRQLVLVVTPGWDDMSGVIRTFERSSGSGPWLEVFDERAISLGAKGLAWGTGLHGSTVGEGPAKKEGDNKSPAGVFSLDLLYGYAPESDADRFGMPYLPLDSADECVDDPSSMYYNMIVDRRNVNRVDWKSSERMRFSGKYYEWGVVVGHNSDPRVPGAGSCIFLHVWGGSDSPTSGCTSLDVNGLLEIMEWLSPSAHPILVQLPQAQHDSLRTAWRLP